MRKTPDIHNGLGGIGTILSYIKEYGIFNIIKSCLLLILISITIKISYDPTYFFEKYRAYVEGQHTAEVASRTKNDLKIKEVLPKYLFTSTADRVGIIHYHNGVSDWLYGSMRFEYCKDGISSIKEQYLQVHLSGLTFPDYLKIHNKFIGSLEQIKEIDKVLYERFKANHIKSLACILLGDINGKPSGILGFTGEHEITEETIQILNNNLSRGGTIISQYIKL